MTRTWVRELAGWLGAVLIALITVAQVASTARSELLFRDGDSLVVPLLVRSLVEGESFDWAMSTVLFLPEAALFALLWMLGGLMSLDIDTLLVVNAIVNLLAFYGVIRLAAGRRRPGRAPVAWSVVALVAFCAVALTEASSSRDALELASLLLTTTYYSATVITVVAAIGILRRHFDHASARVWLLIALGVVAAVSTLTNPLFAAWATVPLGVLLGVAAVYPAVRARALPPLLWLLGGTVLGFLARIPFGAWIANTGAGYAQPTLWPRSMQYYGGLLAERLSSPLGVLGVLLLVALAAVAVRQTFRADEAGARLVAAAGWALPVLVVVGAIALGTNAARYLEPVAFAPVLALVATPRAVRLPRRALRVVPAAAAVLLLVGAGLSVPRAATAAQHPNGDLDCVTDWVTESGRTGAGQFWTVRLPKLHLDDPGQLVQVDHQLRAYAWLVNRTDFAVGDVSFLIEDDQSSPWQLPVSATPTDIVECGQYTIYDFDPESLPIGAPRS